MAVDVLQMETPELFQVGAYPANWSENELNNNNKDTDYCRYFLMDSSYGRCLIILI